jgi:undecaprenyl-diphosphatase
MNWLQLVLLSVVQGAAELLPVSSSAHVIVAEKMMGLDPSSPSMTFILVMLHTGTMCAVLIYFWPRWKKLSREFYKNVLLATVATGVIGLTLKKGIEDLVLKRVLGHEQGELESLFGSLPLIALALLSVGILITWTGIRVAQNSSADPRGNGAHTRHELSASHSVWIGVVQGLCLPFRGFSRSGSTISTGMLLGINRSLVEDFSFALAVVLTPPVVLKELHRLIKFSGGAVHWSDLVGPGLMGMVFSFLAGTLALRWLSSWLESGNWKYFGFYCILASFGVFGLAWIGF